MLKLIKGGTVVNEGVSQRADIVIEDDHIKEICIGATDNDDSCFDVVVNAEGAFVLPGVIDTHVHFREPGLTHKADMNSESRAAAMGGVTSVLEMPNTKPQTTTGEALLAKNMLAADGRMHVNYAFFPGATNDNLEWLASLDTHTVPGIKLFMGSSTGNMLVDKGDALDAIFALAAEKRLPLMPRCEATDTLGRNVADLKERYGTDDLPINLHPFIRSREACVKSSKRAIELARRHGTTLHIAHVTTADELNLISEADKNITMEATVAHLIFSDADYQTLGARIKCNPSIKTASDRDALRSALTRTTCGISTVATDHAPHALSEKEGGALKAMSGMPMVQFSLVNMLQLVDEGVLTMERMVELMCHAPATIFSIAGRGFLRTGAKADIVIVRRSQQAWQVTTDMVESKCRWSPVEGRRYHWHVDHTFINGKQVVNDGRFTNESSGERLTFDR